jgi:hypothetical protein
MTGTRQRWVDLLCLGVGLPVLLALVLVGGVVPRQSPDGIQNSADRAPSSRQGPADPVTAVDLAGWRVFLHAATPDFPSFGPAASADPLAAAARRLPGHPGAATALVWITPRFYRSQAPPSRA